MGRLNTLDFEDVFGKDKNLLKQNAHDAYLAQFNWSCIRMLTFNLLISEIFLNNVQIKIFLFKQ